MKRIKLLLAAGVVGLASALPAETIVLSNRYGRAAVETLGARVVSYVPAGGAETLALLSAGAGGIPLCWPWFQFNGPDGEASPKHGLARYREFEKVSVTQHVDTDEPPAFEDEPDELNWDSPGGTLTGFQIGRASCRERV